MSLVHLEINNLRNLTSVNIGPGSRFNVVVGNNGSGKTSFLEAIHYLGLARSFRTHLHNRVINNQAENFSIFGQVRAVGSLIPLGIERQRSGQARSRINGESIESTAEFAKIFPLQFINADAHRLLLGGPKFRRQFMDWGVFHVEHRFMPLWQRAYRALKQRNAALKAFAPREQIKLWDKELLLAAEDLHILREQYIGQFEIIFQKILSLLLENKQISLSYQRGWPKDRELAEMLDFSLEKDLQSGYTHYGPQRADLLLRVENVPAADMLSQGQQKLAVYALRLAQGIVLQQQAGKRCTYLIDDLSAELDAEKRQLVLSLLIELDTQVFVTSIEKQDLRNLLSVPATKLFHVEHGKVTESTDFENVPRGT